LFACEYVYLKQHMRLKRTMVSDLGCRVERSRAHDAPSQQQQQQQQQQQRQQQK
jgi:hypothetical protein